MKKLIDFFFKPIRILSVSLHQKSVRACLIEERENRIYVSAYTATALPYSFTIHEHIFLNISAVIKHIMHCVPQHQGKKYAVSLSLDPLCIKETVHETYRKPTKYSLENCVMLSSAEPVYYGCSLTHAQMFQLQLISYITGLSFISVVPASYAQLRGACYFDHSFLIPANHSIKESISHYIESHTSIIHIHKTIDCSDEEFLELVGLYILGMNTYGNKFNKNNTSQTARTY